MGSSSTHRGSGHILRAGTHSVPSRALSSGCSPLPDQVYYLHPANYGRFQLKFTYLPLRKGWPGPGVILAFGEHVPDQNRPPTVSSASASASLSSVEESLSGSSGCKPCFLAKRNCLTGNSRIRSTQLTNSSADKVSFLRRIWLAHEISGKSLPKLAHAVETKEANGAARSLEASSPVMMRHKLAGSPPEEGLNWLAEAARLWRPRRAAAIVRWLVRC